MAQAKAEKEKKFAFPENVEICGGMTPQEMTEFMRKIAKQTRKGKCRPPNEPGFVPDGPLVFE